METTLGILLIIAWVIYGIFAFRRRLKNKAQKSPCGCSQSECTGSDACSIEEAYSKKDSQ